MPKKKKFNADKWLKDHLEELVNKFAGEYIVVADGKIYRGKSPGRLRDEAKSANPHAIILGVKVPRPQDFLCALIVL